MRPCGVDKSKASPFIALYLGRIIDAARRKGEVVPGALLAHLAPLGGQHINLTGDYLWDADADVAYHENNPEVASVDAASTSLRCLCCDLHVVSHVAQTTGQVACGASMAQLIEVAGAELAIVRPLAQHMVGCYQDLVCDSDRCTLRAAPGS